MSECRGDVDKKVFNPQNKSIQRGERKEKKKSQKSGKCQCYNKNKTRKPNVSKMAGLDVGKYRNLRI